MTDVRRLGILTLLGAAILAGALFASSQPGADAAPVGAIIDNGTVMLGVWDTGNLNVPDGPASCEDATDIVGLRFVPTGCDSTSPGCTCEGWGAGDAISGKSGWANDDEGGAFNMNVESFTSDATSAVSTVLINDGVETDILRVTHDYHPSPATDNLYEVEVTIENLTGADMNLRYRRVMDWDIEPTAFDEMVTLDAGSASELVYTSDDGFTTADPLDGPSSICCEGSFVDQGPDDHGALFDFDFGTLAAGASRSFITFYGAAATENGADAALAAVGAEAYSYGQTSTDPVGGTPNTFIFAFGNVGGRPIFGEEDEPTATPTPCIPPLIGYRCDTTSHGGGGPAPTQAPTTPTPAGTGQPSASATVAPPTAAASPSGGGAGVGVISAPDTGDGSGTGGGSSAMLGLAALAFAGLAALGGGLAVARRRR